MFTVTFIIIYKILINISFKIKIIFFIISAAGPKHIKIIKIINIFIYTIFYCDIFKYFNNNQPYIISLILHVFKQNLYNSS